MEFTVQLFNRRSMYCVDMFPKIMFKGPWKANTQVNSERKLTQFFSLQVGAMRVVLSHTLRMEFTVQLFNRRSMYCVDMFPKIMLQTDTNFLHVVTCMQKNLHMKRSACALL